MSLDLESQGSKPVLSGKVSSSVSFSLPFIFIPNILKVRGSKPKWGMGTLDIGFRTSLSKYAVGFVTVSLSL